MNEIVGDKDRDRFYPALAPACVRLIRYECLDNTKGRGGNRIESRRLDAGMVCIERAVWEIGARQVIKDRHRRHHDPVLRTAHPRRLGLQEHPVQPHVWRPPPPAPLTVVIARTTPLTASAPAVRTLTRPDGEDRFLGLVVELDPINHGRSLDPEHTGPYLGIAHAVPRSMVLDFDTQNSSRDGVSRGNLDRHAVHFLTAYVAGV